MNNMTGILLSFLISLSLVPVADAPLPEYTPSDLDCSGKIFTILSEPAIDKNAVIAPDELNGNILSDSAYKRNMTVSELYNVAFKGAEYDNAAILIKKAILAGDSAFDLVSLNMSSVMELAYCSYFYDLNDIKQFQLDKPWWNQNITNSLTIGNDGYTYAAACDLSANSVDAASCIYFDKEMLGDSPYKLAKTGNWTFDKLLELTKDGKIGLDGDESALALLSGAKVKLVTNNDGGLDFITADERLTNAAAKLKDIFAKAEDTEAKSLFTVSTIGSAGEYKDCGILPMPKFDKKDEYSSLMTKDFQLIALPITCADVDMCATVTDALAYYSAKYIPDGVYASRTRVKTDVEIMKYIYSSRTIELGSCSSVINDFSGLSDAISGGKIDEWLANTETGAKKAIEKILGIIN